MLPEATEVILQKIIQDSRLGTLRLAVPDEWLELGNRSAPNKLSHSLLLRTWVCPTVDYPFRASMTAILREDDTGTAESHHAEEAIELSNQLNDPQILESTPWRRSFAAQRNKLRLQGGDIWSHATILSLSNENESVVWHLWTTRSERTRVSVVLSRHWREDLSDIESLDKVDSSLEFISK